MICCKAVPRPARRSGQALLLGGLALLLSMGASQPAEAAVTVSNLRSGTVLRYPVAFLRGTSTDGSTVRVVNADNPGPDGTNSAPVDSNRFKLLVELKPGLNRLTLTGGQDSATVDVNYLPMSTEYRVRVIYVTASDGDTRYITQLRDDPQNYREKLDTAAKLMQTFTAESMHEAGFGRKTFGLELDNEGRVVIHTVAYPATKEQLWAKDAYALYGAVGEHLNRYLPLSTAKNLVVMGFNGYDRVNKKPLGFASLGGGNMALYGANAMCAWPSNIRDTTRAFTNATPVDTQQIWDDTDRGYLWGLASTTIGGMLHCLGHTFGLSYSSEWEGIMWGGFHIFNRFFTLAEPPTTSQPGGYRFGDREVARWDRFLASQIAFSRWLYPDQRSFNSSSPPTITVNPTTNEITVQSVHGVRLVQFFQPQADWRFGQSQVFNAGAPGRVVYPYSTLRRLLRLGPTDGMGISVIDTQGNQTVIKNG